MDEEMVEIEIGGLDLLGMEDACTQKAFISIPPTHIQLLKEYLSKAKGQNKLDIQSTHRKDKQKFERDNRKKGRKTDLQRINTLGTRLVESG